MEEHMFKIKTLNFEMPDSLESIARAGAGTNNVPVDKCSEKGIVVFNTPGANANGVKELVIAGLLMSSRDIPGSLDFAKSLADKGDEVPKLVESGKGAFVGPEIQGKTLGVIGLGAIGVLVANAAENLGMTVLGFDPFISVDAAWGLSRKIGKAISVEEVYAKADYITVHVPLMDATKGMIGTDSLALMEDGVKILNFSRAELIDDDAIEAAIKSGKVSKYVTDFPNAKTIAMDNVICIPHLGASTPESEINCAIMAVEQTKDYIENGNINMLGQISTVLAGKNFNIVDMINKSKGEVAYTLLDVEDEVTEEVVNALIAIDGIVKVRVIK
jgi:D-3-phosphoglycerate dehydrogenase